MGSDKPRFTRVIENFTCERCGEHVKGNGYTDHCPNCLTSKHVDVNPGDRASKCRGLMRATSAEYKNGEYVISYECQKCKARHRVNAAQDDDAELLIELSTAHA